MPVDEPLYPVNLRLRGRSVLVVGGGPVALSKVEGLLEGGADTDDVYSFGWLHYAVLDLRYRFYRRSCGRDRRLRELWGESAGH